MNCVEVAIWREHLPIFLGKQTDKVDFNEELTRLRSHMQQFKHTLLESGCVGRKLDFIVQEMNRETNTIASKANSALAGQIAVDIKVELEKIREQIQNIE